jgi:hypothetical protein
MREAMIVVFASLCGTDLGAQPMLICDALANI